MKRQVALDTETTGKSDDGTPGEHRIIEVGCVEIIDRKLTGRTLQLYVNPRKLAFRCHPKLLCRLSSNSIFRQEPESFRWKGRHRHIRQSHPAHPIRGGRLFRRGRGKS